MKTLPVIAGIELTTDEHGRFNLNALHKASGGRDAKRPKTWLDTKQAQELINELRQDSALGQNIISVSKGGSTPGTYAHELLAISYAGWISPAFQLKVNQVFLDYRTGKLEPVKQPAEMSRMEILQLALKSEEERLKLEQQIANDAPKVEFANKVEKSQGAVSVSEAAKMLGTGRTRLFSFLRSVGWISRKNEPYQHKIEQGCLDVKLGSWKHPDHGIQQSVTTIITGKGLIKLREMWDKQEQTRQKAFG